MNQVAIIGRMVRDAEIKTTSTGKTVCEFSIAVDKRVKPKGASPDAYFFRCVAWEKTAEFVSSYVGKGRLISIEGHLQSRKYTASDGTNREVVEINAERVNTLDRPRDDAPASGSKDEYDPFAE